MSQTERIDRPRYLSEHLGDLQKGLVHSLIVVVIGMSLAFWKSDLLFDFLLLPFNTVLSKFPILHDQIHALQTLTPIEAFLINMKLALLGGLLLASPLILREIWVFVSPALKTNERKAILIVFCMGLFFFMGGIAFGYFVIVPISLEFLMKYNIDYHFIPQWTLQGYYGFMVNFLLIFGCVFELPLVLAALVSIGIATPAYLSHIRKYAIFGIFILAALIAPSADPVTQTIVAVPLIVLYEVGIWISYLTLPRKPH